MSKYWSDIVHRLRPYVPGEQPTLPGLIKLNTNENPYPPSPRALEAIIREATGALRLYPDPNADAVKAAAAAAYGVQPDQVFVGNGSDEVLAHAFQGLLRHAQPVLFPDVTYSFYPVYCGLYGIDYRALPLGTDFDVRIDDYRRPNGGIVLANPNAPTGRALPRCDIERLLAMNPDSAVLVDEAYVDFGADSVVPLIDRFPNLLVVHTLSKSRALAGLRVGLAFGARPLIDALERIKNSFNSYPLDRLAIAGSVAALEDCAYFDDSRRRIIATRERLVGALAECGFEVVPSCANFVFARHPRCAGSDLQAALRARSIIVRRFDQPRIADHLRITVGTDDECIVLIAALREILAARPRDERAQPA